MSHPVAAVHYVPIDASEEGRHSPSAEPAWKEAHFASVVDDALSLYYEASSTPARNGADAFCGVVLRDGSLVFVRRRDSASGSDSSLGASVDGFQVSCVEPLQHWSVRYDGDARRYAHPEDLPTGGGHAPCRVTIDLDLRALAEPVRIVGGMTPGIYEQSVRVEGHVVVDGVEHTVDSVGYRNHTWGARTWSSDKRWLAAHATGEPGSGWALSFILSEVAGVQQSYGWVQTPGGGLEEIERVVELPDSRRREGTPFGDAYELTVGADARRVTARFERERHIPLRHREGGRVSTIDEDLGAWRVEDDGRVLVGSGLLEVLFVTEGAT
ncbi:MAG: hypothetical protein JWP74_2705 [Marmoricola sp.]|nr:hypothetical protein [Marmoricola sp.]